jgi:hypothetical protein
MRKRSIPQGRAQQFRPEPPQPTNPPIFDRWFLRLNIVAAALLLTADRQPQFLATATVIMMYIHPATMTGTLLQATDWLSSEVFLSSTTRARIPDCRGHRH